MEAALNTFTGGMDLDTDASVLPSNRYRRAVNYRLTASASGTAGTLETILGNETVLVGGSTIIGDIIGYCWMRDVLVVFTHGPYQGNMYNGIFTVTFTNNFTTASARFIYSNIQLNFNTAYPITAVARYENENVQKVYWTDGLNPVRFINVAPTANSSTLTIDKLEFLPVTLNTSGATKHVIRAIECTGGFYTACKVQYAVQFVTSVGTESPIYIDPSFYHVAIGTENYALDKGYYGGLQDEQVNKGFVVNISGMPTDFDKVRLIAIKYSSYNSEPSINLVREESARNTSTVRMVDLGDTSLGEYTLEDLSIFSSRLFKAKDIETKNDILFAANISNDSWDVTYDARAYRFAGSDNTVPARRGYAGIWQENGSFFEVNSSFNLVYNGQPVPLTYDCINQYNDRVNEVYDVFETRYRYQKDQYVLGGEGINVSYRFNLNAVLIANYGNSTTVGIGDTINGPASGLNEYQNAGYQRGEIYRFGIVLHNNRGQDSPVKWIGDIRFPDISDAYRGDAVYVGASNVTPTTYALSFVFNNCVYSYVLTPKFTVANLPSGVVGYTIVRANRDSSNRTVLCNGLFGGLLYNSNYCFPPPKIADQHDRLVGRFFFDDQTTHTYDSSYDPRGLSNYYFELISPEININKNITYGNYNTDYLVYAASSVQDYSSSATSSESYTIQSPISLGGGYNPPDPFCAAFLHSMTTSYTALTKPYYNPIADFKIVGKCPINNINPISATGGIQLANLLYVNKIDAGNRGYHGTTGVFATTTAVTGGNILLQSPMYCSYMRFNANIYGRSYSSRLLTDYYACSPMLGRDAIVNCYGGDTYITMYEYLRTYVDLEYKASQFSTVTFPVESTINTSLRSDKMYKRALGEKNAFLMQETAGVHTPTWDSTLTYAQSTDLYTYNTVYSQQNISKVFHEKDYNVLDVNSFDCRVIYSDTKINGESIDSWSKFRVNNYKDVDSTYGSLNAIRTFNNQLHFWQTNAFGSLAVNQRELIPSNVTSTASLVLGTGGILDRYDYISYAIGTVDKSNIIRNNFGLYWFDIGRKVLIRYGATVELLSKTKNVNSYFSDITGNPLLAYDPIFNEILIGKPGTSEVLVFSEQLDLFTSFYNFLPTIAYNNPKALLTKSSTTNTIYLHKNEGLVGCFYGTTTPMASLKLVMNDKYPLTKVFDSIEYESEMFDSSLTSVKAQQYTFTNARFYTTRQNTGYFSLVHKSNYRCRERGYTLLIPRNTTISITAAIDILNPSYLNASRQFKDRLRDKYLVMDLDYVGSFARTDYKLKIAYVLTKYRISER